MSWLRLLRKSKSIKPVDAVIDRNHYTTTFKRNEILPREVWEYLVKLRAGFRCENGDSKNHSQKLESHHIIPERKGGKSTLQNGMALCTACHGKAHTIKFSPRNKVSKFLFLAIGKRRYRAFLDELKEKLLARKTKRIVQ